MSQCIVNNNTYYIDLRSESDRYYLLHHFYPRVVPQTPQKRSWATLPDSLCSNDSFKKARIVILDGLTSTRLPSWLSREEVNRLSGARPRSSIQNRYHLA